MAEAGKGAPHAVVLNHLLGAISSESPFQWGDVYGGTIGNAVGASIRAGFPHKRCVRFRGQANTRACSLASVPSSSSFSMLNSTVVSKTVSIRLMKLNLLYPTCGASAV